MSFLSARLGCFKLNAGNSFFFDPTPGFYGFIGQGTTEALNQAIKLLAEHIESKTAPIIEQWKGSSNPLVTEEYDWSSNQEPPGLIRYGGPHHSRIEIAITNKHSPLIMGAILAHELTHHFLALKGISYPDEEENEQLTDLATTYLGLGKLTMNGYYPITWTIERRDRKVTYTYQVGYLSPQDIAAAMYSVCVFRHIPFDSAKSYLSEQALLLFDQACVSGEGYQLKKQLVEQRECLHCGKLVFFGFHQNDDDIYCPECGWEWNTIIKDGRRFWKCPECGLENNRDLIRCVCGYELSR